MAAVTKHARAAINRICDHAARAKGKDGQYIRFGNQNINAEKTKYNYNLAPARADEKKYVRQRCAEVHCLKRDDVKVLCEWCVTVPKELKRDEQKRFFDETYKFLANKFGGVDAKNVVSAYVHYDETTPHLHFLFVPVTFDKKHNRETVSAKLVLNKSTLRTFHPELQAHLETALGHHVGILNGAMQGRSNLTINEYKEYTALQERNRQLAQEVAAKKQAVEELRNNPDELKVKKKFGGKTYIELDTAKAEAFLTAQKAQNALETFCNAIRQTDMWQQVQFLKEELTAEKSEKNALQRELDAIRNPAQDAASLDELIDRLDLPQQKQLNIILTHYLRDALSKLSEQDRVELQEKIDAEFSARDEI